MTEFERLTNSLPLNEYNKKLLPDFIRFIHGPESLQAIVGVCESFINIVSLKGFTGFPYKEAEKFISVAQELVKNKRQIINPLLIKPRIEKAKTVLSGLLGKFPLYSLLYFRSNHNSSAFIKIQQACLMEANNTKLIAADINAYCLAARQLTDVTAAQEWLKKINESDLSSIDKVKAAFEKFGVSLSKATNTLTDTFNAKFQNNTLTDAKSFRDTIKKLEKSKHPELGNVQNIYRQTILVNQLLNAHRFLKIVTGMSVTRHESKNNKEIKSLIKKERYSLGTRGISHINPNEYCELIVFGDVDDENELPPVYSLSQKIVNEEDRKELEEQGVEESEACTNFEFIFVRNQAIPAYAQAYNNTLRARGTIKQMEKQNQFLRLSTQVLNDQELLHLYELVGSMANSPDKLLALLIRCIFDTSSPVDRALQLRIIHSQNNNSYNIDTLYYNYQKREWMIPCFNLDFKTSFNEGANEISRFTEYSHFNLPDILNFSKLLNNIYSDVQSIPESPFADLNNPAKIIRKKLKNQDNRLTLARVERYLTLFTASNFESTQATYLFSNRLSASSARCFYTALSINKYQTIYQDLCQQVLSSLKLNDSQNLTFNRQQNEKYMGARYSPNLSHVKGVINKLQNKISELNSTLLESATSWIQLHNLYTAYVIYIQGFLTCIRSIETPFVGPNEIIKELRMAVYRDKDTEDQFHTRTIPLHPLVTEICDKYIKHRFATLVRLAALNPKSAHVLKGEDSPFVFFIKDKGEWETVRPGRINKLLETYTLLPLNSNRKLVRNFLLENSISPHAIDTLMGHASRGEPFWGTSSTRSFSDISDELIQGLELLASPENIGITPIKGLQV